VQDENFGEESENVQVAANLKVLNKKNLTLSPICKQIILYWFYRSKNLRKAESLVGGYLERNSKKFC
jgi:hypothetical protein